MSTRLEDSNRVGVFHRKEVGTEGKNGRKFTIDEGRGALKWQWRTRPTRGCHKSGGGHRKRGTIL
jgi:hypothetical protein